MRTKQSPVESFKFSFVTDGTTGPEWVRRLEAQGHTLDHGVLAILGSDLFVPTSGVAMSIEVLYGFDRVRPGYGDEEVHDETKDRGLVPLTLEAACYIRAMFTDQQIRGMGLSRIIVLHPPVADKDLPDAGPDCPPSDEIYLFCVDASYRGSFRLDLLQVNEPGEPWGYEGVNGFASARV